MVQCLIIVCQDGLVVLLVNQDGILAGREPMLKCVKLAELGRVVQGVARKGTLHNRCLCPVEAITSLQLLPHTLCHVGRTDHLSSFLQSLDLKWITDDLIRFLRDE